MLGRDRPHAIPVPSELAGAVARTRATGYPRVEELAVRYVLNPPSEAESLERLSLAELR
jgi:hypothetical protein